MMPDPHTGTDWVDDAPLFRDGVGPVVLFMGDSRAKQGGTFDQLVNPVYNLGVSGSTTFSMIHKLYRIDQIKPDYLFISTGINDVTFSSITDFIANLTTIVTYAKARGVTCYILDQCIEPAVDSSNYITFGNAMDNITNAPYLRINYSKYAFSDDKWHLNARGYLTMTSAIRPLLIPRK
jgi:lysophospholipase L1-like esterase